MPIPSSVRRTLEVTERIYNGADCYPWTRTFVMWPRRSIVGSPIFWEWAYKRKVWLVWGSGFHMEPEVEYATILDIMCNPEL